MSTKKNMELEHLKFEIEQLTNINKTTLCFSNNEVESMYDSRVKHFVGYLLSFLVFMSFIGAITFYCTDYWWMVSLSIALSFIVLILVTLALTTRCKIDGTKLLVSNGLAWNKETIEISQICSIEILIKPTMFSNLKIHYNTNASILVTVGRISYFIHELHTINTNISIYKQRK